MHQVLWLSLVLLAVSAEKGFLEDDLTHKEQIEAYRILRSLSYKDLLSIREQKLDKRAVLCGKDVFNCFDGSADACKPTSVVCDGKDDCENKSDEDQVLCEMMCATSGMNKAEWEAGYVCQDSYTCLSAEDKCDRSKCKDKLVGTQALGCKGPEDGGKPKKNTSERLLQLLARLAEEK